MFEVKDYDADDGYDDADCCLHFLFLCSSVCRRVLFKSMCRHALSLDCLLAVVLLGLQVKICLLLQRAKIEKKQSIFAVAVEVRKDFCRVAVVQYQDGLRVSLNGLIYLSIYLLYQARPPKPRQATGTLGGPLGVWHSRGSTMMRGIN